MGKAGPDAAGHARCGQGRVGQAPGSAALPGTSGPCGPSRRGGAGPARAARPALIGQRCPSPPLAHRLGRSLVRSLLTGCGSLRWIGLRGGGALHWRRDGSAATATPNERGGSGGRCLLGPSLLPPPPRGGGGEEVAGTVTRCDAT